MVIVVFDAGEKLFRYINSAQPGNRLYKEIHSSIHVLRNQIRLQGLKIEESVINYGTALYKTSDVDQKSDERIEK